MSQSALKNNNSIYLDDVLWKKHYFLENHVTIHTIQCRKVSNELVNRLQDNNFKITDEKYNQAVFIQGKKSTDFTEIQEVHLDKLKVTEAVIVSRASSTGKNKKIFINESEPEQGLSSKKLRIIDGQNTEAERLLAKSEVSSEQRKQEDKEPAQSNVIVHDYKKIEHEKFIFRQEVVRKKNSYFMRAKNSESLFKLGNSYYDDFKVGCRNFSFINLGSPEIQKKSVLGIASFIYYYENLRILIITHSMLHSCYAQFKNDEYKLETKILEYPSFKYNIHVHEGLSYLELDEIVAKSKESNMNSLEFILGNIVNDYDVVLYDLPTMEEIKKQYSVFFPMLKMLQNVSFVVCFAKNTFSEVEELQKYFKNYNIKVKGIVVGHE